MSNKNLIKAMWITFALILVAATLLIAIPAFAWDTCPVCGDPIDYNTEITWQTWEVNGFQHSGWILCCTNCCYTTERDANGNVPDPVAAKKAWQVQLFPWLENGWTHEQYVEFYK
jgi:hypothetical protein